MGTNHHEVNPQIAISKGSPTPACSSQMSGTKTVRCLASHTEGEGGGGGGGEKRGNKIAQEKEPEKGRAHTEDFDFECTYRDLGLFGYHGDLGSPKLISFLDRHQLSKDQVMVAISGDSRCETWE